MTTPHISAAPGQIAPAVIMPGDPLRAERIAKILMPESHERVSYVRGIGCFTGEYQGKPLSVMASGMGCPSISIYANELYKFYGVEKIIRVGTAGGISPKVKIGDVVIAIAAHTDSAMNTNRIRGIQFAPAASYKLLRAAADAGANDPSVHVAPIVSKDHFYGSDPKQTEELAAYGTMAVEMEAAGLYAVAMEHGKHALAVMTISDHIVVPGNDMSAEERETNFQRAISLAVAAAIC